MTDTADVKAKAALRWINAVNRLAKHGTWHYLLVTDPGTVGKLLNATQRPSGMRGSLS